MGATAHFSSDSTPSSCHHAGDEGHEAQGHEEGRGGGTSDEGNEGHESHEGHEEGYEGYEGHEEGNEGHESHEGNEGHEEVNGWKCESLPLIGNGHESCLVLAWLSCTQIESFASYSIH